MAGYSRVAAEDHDTEHVWSGGEERQPEGTLCRIFQPLLRVVLETCFLGLLYLSISVVVLGKPATHEPVGYRQLPQALRDPPKAITIFEEDTAFSGKTENSTAAWNSLIPKGRGFIIVDKSSRAGLQPGIAVSETSDRYSLSSFHQLHCLATIREAYYETKDEGNDNNNGEATATAHHNHHDLDHLDHCFDYLRQAIMCAADPAIEAARVEEDGSRRTVDGWGAQHQCRSWAKLFGFALENRADDREGILNSI